jgi:D-alanyl-D-alanine carboxypeptidase (penicillin-binding protein 5/6)
MRIFFLSLLLVWLSHFHAAYGYETEAKQAILIDAKTGQILFQSNGTELMHPSSMTKIMTTYLAFEDIKSGKLSLSDKFITSEKAWKMEGSRMFLNYGDAVTLDDLLKGIIVQSGNDACVVFAEGSHGDESLFVERMNKTAAKLGMKQTNFTNSSGWPDPRNLSTAKDLSKLALRLIRDFPEYYDYHKISNFTYGNIKQNNRNILLGRLGVDGIKTGHTEAGGYGIVLSALNKDRRLIAVINGLPTEKTRAQEGEKILNYGFNAFEYVNLFKANQKIETIKVQYGKKPFVNVGVKEDMKILSNNTESKFQCEFDYPNLVVAPINEGDKLGTVRCNIPNIDGNYITSDLVAIENIKNANFIQKIYQNIEYFFSSEE